MSAVNFINSLDFARTLDRADPLRSYRDRFHMPQHGGKEMVYFTGNSLGLQPKTTGSYLPQELDAWADYGVEGHFKGKNPGLGRGHDKATRFQMDKTFLPMQTAQRWQISNAPVLSMAACRAALDIYAEAGMVALGILPDWREPNVIRCAPVPLYNSFEVVHRFGQILDGLL